MPRSRQRGSKQRIVSPIGKNAQYERVDQGVDWSQPEPYVAVADGKVTAISRGWHGGTGIGVYITLDHPITVNGRTYDQVYYAELRPLVRVGERVHAGQAVVAGGAGELGFAANNGPVAPLAGGFGAGTQSSVAGHDFLDLAQGDKNVQIGNASPIGRATASAHESLPRSQGGGIGFEQLPPDLGSGVGGNEAAFGFGAQTSQDQEGAFGLTPYQVADVWQQMAGTQFASPETRQLANNAADLINNVPNLLAGP
jgi:hypothetical protein